MADIQDAITSIVPSFDNLGLGGVDFTLVLTIFIVAVLIMILIGIAVYFLIQQFRFNKKIIIFERVGNNWEQTGKDKAIELRTSIIGDTVFYLRKRKKYLPRPELQSGRRTYWYAIREDGEWINISIEDIDLKMKNLGAKFLHPEIRHARTALYRNLKERYDKPKFLEKYGVLIVNTVVIILMMLIFLWVINVSISFSDKAMAMQDVATQAVDRVDTVLRSLDNICSSSGYKLILSITKWLSH